MRACLTLLLVAVAYAELAPLLENVEPIPGKYIIKLKDEINVDEVTATVRLSGGHVRHIFRYVINAFAAELSDHVLDIVRGLPGVEYVEQDGVSRVQAEATLGDFSWGIDRIDHRTPKSFDDAYTPHISGGGKGATVWVLDTGVRSTHEQFKGTLGSRANIVLNTVDRQDEDCNGHGTHCCGTVGGSTVGVANQVTIKAVKVMNCNGYGSTAGIVAGLDHVAINAGKMDVASMSIGGGVSTSLDQAVASLIAREVPTAVAAGNDNRDACYYSPARVASAITVGATNERDKRSPFSNYGSCLNIFAPGSNIRSAGRLSDTQTMIMSGTSMACPHVAGAIALYGTEFRTTKEGANKMMTEVTKRALEDVGTGSPNELLYV